MTEEKWLLAEHPASMMECLDGKTTERKLRLLGCASVRYVWALAEETLPSAIRLSEEFADGLATKAALRRARREVREERHGLEAAEAGMRPMWGAYWLAEVLASENAFGSVLAELDRLSGDILILETGDWKAVCGFVRDIFGNPFRPVAFDARWRTSDVTVLARTIYEDRAFDRMPILADALMDAGCEDEAIIGHCRSDGPHVRGCWVLDLVLGKA